MAAPGVTRGKPSGISVLVCGGGVGGLMTALECWRKGCEVRVFERTASNMPGWPEVADRVIRATPPDSIVDWKLMWRDPQPTWISPGGHVVQLGDAAHTFLPTSGNGGTQALEDAVSLATCLSIAGKARIPEATRVHNLLRFERVSCLQAFGIVNARTFSTERRGDKSSGGDKSPVNIGRWMWGHDPEQYAVEKYEEALAHLTKQVPTANTNTPPGHVYKPWTIDGLLAAAERGEATVLDGEWE